MTMSKKIQVTVTIEEYARTASSKSWKSKPHEVSTEKVDMQWMRNYTDIDTMRFFRRLGSSQRVDRGYTSCGYNPVRATSVSPCRTVKKVVHFKYDWVNA